MGDAYVVAEADVEGVRLDGDTALVKTTIGLAGGARDRGGAGSGLSPGADGVRRRVTVRLDDQPELRGDSRRTFRYLVKQDAGCRAVTQFVGLVETYRAPDHSHAYDEVGYIVAGRGFVHVDGTSTPIGPGSCFHLPPDTVHCIESSGAETMVILGVFHPAGDPASRSYDAAATRVSPLQRERST